MSWGPFLRGFVGTDGVVDPVLGEAEADVEVLGSDFVVRGYSGLGERSVFRRDWSSSSISASSGESGDGRTPRGLTGSPSMLAWSDTTSAFTLDGDLDREPSKVMEDVEASGEGYSCSDLRAIARNLDMVRAPPQSSTSKGLSWALGRQARVVQKKYECPWSIKRALNIARPVRRRRLVNEQRGRTDRQHASR